MKRLGFLAASFGVLLILALPASGSPLYTAFTYAKGTGGKGGTFDTAGYSPRQFNRVWHKAGTTWRLRYCHTDGSCTSWYPGYANPVYDERNDSYGQAECNNVNDTSGVEWTCQTTNNSTAGPTRTDNSAEPAHPANSAASSMSALRSMPAVALPASLDNAVAAVNDPPGAGVPASQTVGVVDPANARLLLNDVGSLGVSVYAAATANGDVCSFPTRGAGGCIDEFDQAVPIIWGGEESQSGKWLLVTGLVPDNVRGVSVEEGATTQQTILQNNAFYVQPDSQPKAIIVTYDDGMTRTVALASPGTS